MAYQVVITLSISQTREMSMWGTFQVELVCVRIIHKACVSIGNVFYQSTTTTISNSLTLLGRCKKTLLQHWKKLKEVGQSLYAICLQFLIGAIIQKMSTQSTPNFICKWIQSFNWMDKKFSTKEHFCIGAIEPLQ